MKNITSRKQWNELRDDIIKALGDVETKWGITFNCGKISYGNVDFTLQLKGLDSDEEDVAQDEMDKFNRLCSYYGFDKQDYYKFIKVGNTTYAFSGFNTRARKYPCRLVDINDSNKITYASARWVQDRLADNDF